MRLAKQSNPMQDQELVFSPGFIWERHYIKRAVIDGRMVNFRISVPLIARCFSGKGAVTDPVRILTANDTAVQEACRRALARCGDQQATNVDLQDDDFAP